MYISIAWSLIVSYQLFTQIAVYSLVGFLSSFGVPAGELLASRVETIVFIHAFAWIFVLASVIPSIILGKGRSILLQFFLCLTLTLVAVSVEGILALIIGTNLIDQIRTASAAFYNPLIAGLYLSAPYLFMLYLDIRSRRGDKAEETTEEERGEPVETAEEASGEPEEQEEEEEAQEAESVITEGLASTEQDLGCGVDCVEVADPAVADSTSEGGHKRKAGFLYATAAVCFLLAVVTVWFDGIILSTVLGQAYGLIYVVMFTGLGSVLATLGYYATSVFK